MSVKNLSNVAHSVRDRLLRLSREGGRDFNYVLQRYAYERFYFRLGKSSYSARFVLKGASLFAVWLGPMFRVTQDTDFESNLTPDHEGMRRAFEEILATPVPEDGMNFDGESLTVEDIKKEDKYKGLRVRLTARLGVARIPLQLDIGFGDSIYPSPVYGDYPTLLPGEAPRVKLYPQYTVLAEKISTIVDLGMRNSRLKDYFDLWVLLGRFSFDCALFCTALRRTFKRRGLCFPETWPTGLTDEFAADEMKQSQWRAFLRRIEPEDRPASLLLAVERVRSFLEPIFRPMSDDAPKLVWRPPDGWIEE